MLTDSLFQSSNPSYALAFVSTAHYCLLENCFFLYTADEATETDRCTDVNKHGNAFLFGKVAPVGAESSDRRHSSVIVSVVLCTGDVRARRSVSVHVEV